MNELQAMAIAALEACKDEAELARLRAAVARESKLNTPRIGVLHVEVQVPYYAELLREAEYRHARISGAIDWVKAIPQFDHITTHKATELRNRGYKDVGVVLQDDLGSTAVIAHGKVTWTEPVSVTAPIAGLEAIIKNAILSNSHPAPDWHLAFNCADEIDIVANQIATKFAELANQQTAAQPAQKEKTRYSDIVSDGGLDPRNKYDVQAQPTATPCGQVTTTQTGQHTCTTMRVGDSKICPDCNPKRNFLEWLGDQYVPWTDKDVRELHAVLDTYPPEQTKLPSRLEPDYYVSDQHGELKASYTDESDTVYKWVPVIARSKVQS